MAYTANKYRTENTKPIPLFFIGQFVENDCIGNCYFNNVITGCEFMHNEWYYIVENLHYAESTIKASIQ